MTAYIPHLYKNVKLNLSLMSRNNYSPDFFKKNLDKPPPMYDIYNRIVGNTIVANGIVTKSRR